jgi:hypothetical protein
VYKLYSLPSCNIAPEIIGLSLEDSCLPIVVYSTQLITINHSGSSVTISDITKSNITMLNSTIYYKNII